MGLLLVVMGIAIIACKTQGVVDLSFFFLFLSVLSPFCFDLLIPSLRNRS